MKEFLKRHALWAGLLAVLLPLAILLGLQLGWLVDLERSSAIAEKAFLENYLTAVASRVEYFYRAQGERVLNPPASLFRGESPDRIGLYFAKRKPSGVTALFVVNFAGDWGGIRFFDPRDGRLAESPDTELLHAASVAIAPWKALGQKELPLGNHSLAVDERDPDRPIVLNAVTDDTSRVLGVAGMVMDREYFVHEVLPRAIGESLPNCAGAVDREELLRGTRQDLVLGVRDGAGRPVMGSFGQDHEKAAATSRNLSFVFSDWQLALRGREMTPEEWAKSNFMLNVSLTALLAIALLGGIVFAFRTASREIRLSRMKSDFVSNVSHELRTPLASIRVFGELMRLGRVKGELKTREYGEFIENESRRLTQLINNILDCSRIESGAKTYNMEPHRLDEVVADTLRTLEVVLRHKGIRLQYATPRRPLPYIQMDADAIAQALTNLVDNAVKYSGISRDVHVALERHGDEACIRVVDQGIGISGSEQAKIFERFHRVSTGLVHDVKGSGLGLSIVAHIAEAHGGNVTVVSEEGRGSTFTIHLPLDSETRPGHPFEEAMGEQDPPVGLAGEA